MNDTTTGRRTDQLNGLIAKVTSPPNTRAGASNETAICKDQLLKFCLENCSAEKVFGCPRGELPAVPEAASEDEVAPEDNVQIASKSRSSGPVVLHALQDYPTVYAPR